MEKNTDKIAIQSFTVPRAESIFLHTPTYRVTFLAGETSRVSQGNTRGVSRRRRRRGRKRKRRRNEKNDLLAWSREEGCVVDTDRKRESHSQTERGRETEKDTAGLP